MSGGAEDDVWPPPGVRPLHWVPNEDREDPPSPSRSSSGSSPASSLHSPLSSPAVPAVRPPLGRRGRTRRIPVRMPPGMVDSSAEGAAFLVRVKGVVVLVDGYNVTMWAWPDVSILEQRQRLISAMSSLALSASATFEIIFDGDDLERLPSSHGIPRSLVRVRFSLPGSDADQLIVDRLKQIPPEIKVVVATNDVELRERAARRGANVISCSQLLGAVGLRSHGSDRDW